MSRSLPWHLAFRELRHDWQAALCFVAALAGVLAPLLILLALKNGVIEALVEGLVDDPANREIIAVGAQAHGPDFFADIGQRPQVAFLIPATRTINAAANGLRNPETRRLERSVPLIVSGQGDPLLPAGADPVVAGAIWLSARLAAALEADPGDTLEMIIGRDIDGQRQTVRSDVSVLGVLPSERYGRDAAFVSLPDLLAIERYRDDISVTPETWDAPRPEPQSYPSFRLYVNDLGDLRLMEEALEARGVQARARAENAAMLLSFRQTLDQLYIGVAALALMGFWAAMAANLRGMVERQRVSFSLLRMLGLTNAARAAIPLIQSVTLVGLGVCATLLVLGPALVAINAGFASGPGGYVAWLGWRDVLATLLIGLLTALTAALWAVRAVAAIETDEVLHHG